MPSPKHLLAGAAVLGALALPAAACAAQVEHTVTDVTFTASYTIPGVVPWHHVEESWVSPHRAREVTRDADGKVLDECASANGRTRCWSASDNTVTTFPAEPPDPAWASWQYRGELIRRQVAMGWYRVAGDTTVLGRPAKILEDTHVGPRDGNATTSIVVDAATFAPLRRTTTGSGNGQSFTQTETVTTFELENVSAARLRMSHHTRR